MAVRLSVIVGLGTGLAGCGAEAVPVLVPVVVQPEGLPGGPPSETATGEAPDPDATLARQCDPAVAASYVDVCLATTADFASLFTPVDTGEYALSGSGTVVEVGGLLGGVSSSVAVDPFRSCGAQHEHQVRLVDANGETWTFGWGLEGLLDGSTDAITVGAEVDFLATYREAFLATSVAFLLADERGPLFLVEHGGGLTAEERGGIDVDVRHDATCSAQGDRGPEDHHEVRYSWAGGHATLFSGLSTSISLPERELELLQAVSMDLDLCDAGSTTQWVAWAEPQ